MGCYTEDFESLVTISKNPKIKIANDIGNDIMKLDEKIVLLLRDSNRNYALY